MQVTRPEMGGVFYNYEVASLALSVCLDAEPKTPPKRENKFKRQFFFKDQTQVSLKLNFNFRWILQALDTLKLPAMGKLAHITDTKSLRPVWILLCTFQLGAKQRALACRTLTHHKPVDPPVHLQVRKLYCLDTLLVWISMCHLQVNSKSLTPQITHE